MNILVEIIDGPLNAPGVVRSDSHTHENRLGAWLRFEGIVRADESGRRISALTYQTYEPMAQQMLRELASDIISKHGLLEVRVFHSRGVVPVGACSFRLDIFSSHRKSALLATDEFIDRLKRDVPIWKSAVWSD